MASKVRIIDFVTQKEIFEGMLDEVPARDDWVWFKTEKYRVQHRDLILTAGQRTWNVTVGRLYD